MAAAAPLPPPDDEPGLTAYRVASGPAIRLVPAGRGRDWIDATTQRFANRCLPLLIANQSGWWLLNSHDFTVRWDGTRQSEGLTVRYRGGDEPYPAVSHFGHGVLTFTLPFLFRTPPGWNLLARGPANLPKDGIAALEGVVETDWSTAAFTMNWQVTRPNVDIGFAVGEPVCMIVPQRRGELERVRPSLRPVEQMADRDKYLAWRESRAEFLRDLPDPDSPAARAGWQRDYMLGRDVDGEYVTEHQRKLRLREFDGQEEFDGRTAFDGQVAASADESAELDPALKYWI